MLGSSRCTSVAERAVDRVARGLCGAEKLQTAAEEEVAAELVVLTASSGGSGKMQEALAVESSPMSVCLLKRTDAISSARLYSNTQ